MSDLNSQGSVSLKRVVIKGLLFFLLIDLLFAVFTPVRNLGTLSAYNVIFPGRVRLPYGEVTDQAYNLSLYNLEAMFASHELANGSKPAGEFRVLLIGDSSVWGYLLKPEQTLAAYINSANIQLADQRILRAYNLGYPTMSMAKDLMILDYAVRYQPDLIIWLVTLESLPVTRQLESPIVQNNPTVVQHLISHYSLNLDVNDSRLANKTFLGSTLIGQRRALADWVRLQLYGIMWAATGVDQYYPAFYDPPQRDLSDDLSFMALQPSLLKPDDLSFDILSAGVTVTGDVPVLFVNEPIYVSNGLNSDIRYNFFYPHWAYDQYRQLFQEICQQQTWSCMDEWNLVPAAEFTNSAIHLTPQGTHMLATQIVEKIKSMLDP